MLSQAVCLGMSLRESIEQLLYVIKISSTGTRKFGIKKKKNIIPSNLKLIRNHNTNSPFMPPELRSKPPEGENPKISLLKTLKRKWVGYSGRHSQRDKMLILLQACKIGNIAVAGRYNISMKSIEDWRAWFKKRGAGGLIDLTGAVKKYGIPEKKVLEWYEQFKSEENGLPSMNDIRRFVATLPTPPPLGESFISYAMHRNHLEIVSPSPEKRKVQKEIKRYIRETFPIIGESMKKIEVVVNTSEMALFEDIQGLFSRQTPMDSRNPLKRHLQQNRDRICLILSICSDGTLLSPMFIFRSKWSSSMNKNKNSSKIMEQRKEYFGYYTEPKIIVEGTETGWNSAPHGDRIGQQIVQKYLPGRVMWVRDSSVQRPLSEKQPEQLTSIILPYNCAVFAQPLDAGRIFDQIKEVIRMKYFIFLKSHGMTPHLPDLLIHWTISAIKDLTPRRIKEAFVLAGILYIYIYIYIYRFKSTINHQRKG